MLIGQINQLISRSESGPFWTGQTVIIVAVNLIS